MSHFYPNHSINNYSNKFNYNSTFAEPSAPPLSLYPEPSAPLMEEDPIEEDECGICLESLNHAPEEDHRRATVLAKTVCNHFFHDFCLQKHLVLGMNKNCPYCRTSLEGNKITQIDISDPIPHVPKESFLSGYLAASVGTATVGWNVIKFIGKSLFNVAKQGASFAFSVDPKVVSTKLMAFYRKWDEKERKFTKNSHDLREDVSLLIATLQSLPASRKIQTSVKELERKTELLEQQLQQAQEDFRKYVREEMDRIKYL